MSYGPATRVLFCLLLFGSTHSLYAGVAASAQKSGKNPQAIEQSIDTCSLLTGDDLQAAVGESLEDTRPSIQPAGAMRMSQCIFRVATPAKSVSLTVATANHSSSALREFWRKQFHALRNDEEERPARGAAKTQSAFQGDSEEEARKPRRITGLGEEAYWVGTSFTGALYVLQGEAFLRVSVGGIREESARLEKSKGLAAAALARLHSALAAGAAKR